MTKQPLLLMILDGWGMKDYGEADCLAMSELPNFDRLWETYPHTSLSASGLDVGLPEGQMGNSEVGHMNIGAGRIVYQDLTMISKDIREGGFFRNEALVDACEKAKANGGALHLLGLVSDGGVHSHLEHLCALLELAKRQGLSRVFVHCFMDGRDTPTDAGREYLAQLEQAISDIGCGRIASVCGRFYAMDRDKRWNRVEKAYRMLVEGRGDHQARTAAEAIENSYAAGVSDEFVEPTVIVDDNGAAVGPIRSGDAVVFFNFRADRAREISHALTDDEFSGFDRGERLSLSAYVTMTVYDETLTNVTVAYPPKDIEDTFAEVISRNGLRQLHIAETEKYAHVTFFFNGGVEEPVAGEDRCLIPSPKVKTYDLQPEMSAGQVCDEVIRRIKEDVYDVVILNFANPDMVGHTGVIEAACRAVTFVDGCIGKVVNTVLEASGRVLLTADHGNVECLRIDGEPMTAHTTNPVPFILIDDKRKHCRLRDGGRLEDIAPTMLHLLGLPQPELMTGRSLIIE